jgi:urease accessory protein
MAISTTDPSLALFAWLSPAYPVGAFAYSHGLEWAVECGDVTDGASLYQWIDALLAYGSGRNDALLFSAAWRSGPTSALTAIAELAVALAPSKERRLESLQQGGGFLAATQAAWPCAKLNDAIQMIGAHKAYPVCFAASLAAHDLPLRPALDGFIAAFAGNLVSAAVRLSVLGQTEAQAILARLSPRIAGVADATECGALEDLGSCAFRADLASMKHETQYSRLFRS